MDARNRKSVIKLGGLTILRPSYVTGRFMAVGKVRMICVMPLRFFIQTFYQKKNSNCPKNAYFNINDIRIGNLTALIHLTLSISGVDFVSLLLFYD